MKRKFYFVILTLIAATLSWQGLASAKEDGAPSGSASAPADEGSCARVDCHTGSAVPRSGFITTDIPLAGYIPGEAYTIQIGVSSENRNTFGFQFTPQDAAGNKVGTIAVLDGDRTKLTGLGKYITHKKNGIDGTDGVISWNFTWTAPATSVDLALYVAVNIADGDGDATGDSIFITNLPISADPLATAMQQMDLEQVAWMHSLAGNYLQFAQWIVNEQPVVEIWNLNGQLLNRMTIQETLMPLDKLKPGYYLVTVQTSMGRLTDRFVRQ